MKNRTGIILALIICSICIQVQSQDISVFQFRQVANDQIEEFIHRETTYWSEVARKAIDKGNLVNWALFRKVGGYDLPNTSNFLFINTLKDIDGDMSKIWDVSAVFPDMSVDKMETWSMSTVTSQIFVKIENFEVSSTANPSDDFKFIKFNFWNSTSPEKFVELETEYWTPFIKAEMPKDGSSQVGWGNGLILSPRGPKVPANSLSFDVYSSLKEALIPNWSEGVVFPMEGFAKLQEITTGRTEVIYRMVKAVTN